MQGRLLPLLKGLGVAQELEPELDGALARVPAGELLDGGQRQGHDGRAASTRLIAGQDMSEARCSRRRGRHGGEKRTRCQKVTTSTTTLHTARTAPMVTEDGSRGGPPCTEGGCCH